MSDSTKTVGLLALDFYQIIAGWGVTLINPTVITVLIKIASSQCNC